jgi:hypothetical protein
MLRQERCSAISEEPVAGLAELPVFVKQGDQVGEPCSGGGAWAELKVELGQSAAILALSSDSRAFSFLSCPVSLAICSVSLAICCILCSCAILRCCSSFSICSVSLLSCCSHFSSSTVGCQLSFDSSRRHGGKDARKSCLLR